MKIEDLKQIAIYAAKGEAPANYTTESVDDSFLEGIRDLASDYYQFMDNRYAIYDIIVTAIDEVVPSRVADALAPIAEFDEKIEAAAADYQELTRLLGEKEGAEAVLMDLMEQWGAAQE